MHQPKRILVCPLDWGLGHATRCIPIIHLLVQKGAEVIIAADGRALTLLRQEFPLLKFIRFHGYNISYPDKGSMTIKMILSVPKIVKGIKREHFELEQIIHDNQIDIVISDNRYGCWNKKTKNIFITHQLMIKSICAENLLHKIVLNHIKNYQECWVPDFENGNNLSGDLSHKFPMPDNTFFIGPLSRFNNKSAQKENSQSEHSSRYDLMFIISGPEPQRSNFEKIILNQINKSKLKILVVLGKPEQDHSENKNNIKIVSHLSSDEMRESIINSDLIISRSGYSTIMDLAILGKKAVFIPTPGQTEQEYLAKILMDKKINFMQSQSEFNLEHSMKISEKYSGFSSTKNTDTLSKKIESILFST